MSFTLFQELLEQSDSEAERSSASGRRVWRVAVLLGGLALVAAAVWSVGRSKVRSGSRDSVDLGGIWEDLHFNEQDMNKIVKLC